MDVNKIGTVRKSSPTVSMPNEDEKNNVKTDLDVDDIIFVNDSPKFDFDQSSQDEDQIDTEIQQKEGQGDPLNMQEDDPLDLSSNSESNESVIEVTDNIADEDPLQISCEKKKNVVEFTGFA
jgi:hypothetical protein